MKKITSILLSMIIICCTVFLANSAVVSERQVVFAAEEIEYGDVNQDGNVTLEDAQLSLRAALGIETLSEAGRKAIDVDGNQLMDLADAQLILQKALRIIEIFPAQGNSQTPNAPSVTNEPLPSEPQEGKTLIVYFSWSSSSNTEKMANAIAEQTGGTVHELIPLNPYPEEYAKCTEVALEERDNNARPAIKEPLASLEEYDHILIGYPIWWHTAPMIIGTFLESYDLSGVDIYPFSQSASMNREQFENSMEFIRGCANGANVHDGLFARATDGDSIASYLTENGLIENK